MDNMSQGGCKETVLPIYTGEAKDKNQLNLQARSCADWVR